MNDSAFLNSRRTGIFKDMSNGTICIPKDLRDNNGLEKNAVSYTHLTLPTKRIV